ncbi:MAG: DUF4229 domain-containing protein [Brachybacterium sp.]|uniref:DUF4229 domain-containing protein n=1 Tax=Brachybacterium sp. TaxID=1891286 RepID=UPI002656C178|nr:DUF4229 domain-containing protein [Brachybacterium sp.]MDN6302426.1 DUF4229 domain-containing protein [Brachybacterium sp.]MDN6329684.1 DUF4229 domain-containing protein [Brachybacterium sp.]
MRPFLFYAIVRLGLWVLLWWVLTLLGIGVALAGVLAALISMLLSILFLDRLRDAVAQRWKAADDRRAERRSTEVDEDAEYEDGVLDDAAVVDAAAVDGDADAHDADAGDVDADDAADEAEIADPSGPAGLPDLGDEDELRGSDR